MEEDYATARSYLDQALAIGLKINYAFIVGTALHHLGLIAVDADENCAEAQRLYERSLTVFRALGAPRSVGLVSTALADVLRMVGDYERARATLPDAIRAMAQIGNKLAHPIVVDAYAHLAFDMGQPERAVRFAAAALHTRRVTGVSAWPGGERNRTRWLAEARGSHWRRRLPRRVGVG